MSPPVLMRRIEFRDQTLADAWILQNKLKRTHLPTGSPRVFYLIDSGGDIVGQWQQISRVDRAINGISVVEICWYDQRKVEPPRELVN